MANPLAFEECGCCGDYHRPGYTGDCRDNSERFSLDRLEALGKEGEAYVIIAIEE